jgi:DNA adenine methylase
MDFKSFLSDMPKITFGYPGGKARMTSWLFNYFPKEGRQYIEPFAGVGNVFFAAKKTLHFKKWHINDQYNYAFLKSLIEIDPETLPDRVSKEDFEKWKSDKSHAANVIGPRITFLSKGYEYGYSGDSNNHIGYRGERYKPMIKTAKELITLPNVTVTGLHWEKLPYTTYNKQDFVYFDPPYYDTKSIYPNIDHEALLKHLKVAQYKWILSGYDNDLYKKEIKNYWKASKVRNAEMSGMNKNSMQSRTETIWSNF